MTTTPSPEALAFLDHEGPLLPCVGKVSARGNNLCVTGTWVIGEDGFCRFHRDKHDLALMLDAFAASREAAPAPPALTQERLLMLRSMADGMLKADPQTPVHGFGVIVAELLAALATRKGPAPEETKRP